MTYKELTVTDVDRPQNFTKLYHQKQAADENLLIAPKLSQTKIRPVAAGD